MFNWPRLDVDAVQDQYDGDYYVFNQQDARRWSRTAQLYIEQLLPLEQSAGRTLLDIGCARGDLLAIARERGWHVQGLELSASASRQARREHGLKIHTGTVEQHAATLGTFDVVISSDVIEHVMSPTSFVTSIRGLVRTGGTAIVETPNWGSAWRRFGGSRWLGLNRFHLFFFNEYNLRRLMRQCGFRSCRVRTSTNTAYAEWGIRPELAPVLNCLPAGLRWRAERALNRLTPPAEPVRLRRQPPGSIDEALQWIERSSDAQESTHPQARWHDNLTVIGRA